MSSIKSRLQRVESASRASARCPVCRLRPQEKGYIVVDDKDPAGELPEVCPECGRNTRIRIVVVEEGAEGGGGESYWPDARR